ncbi:hypothetical protein [Vibrio phage Va2]|nr:hypothetical protein [Vibrio phage Va2]
MIGKTSVGFEQIKHDLLESIKLMPDAEKWGNYFQMSEAATLLDLFAGVSSFLQYNSIMAAREAGITTNARLKTSIYGAADILGYPINRRQSMRFKLNIISTKDVWLDRNNPIGSIGSARISLAESKQINIGHNIVDCVLGEWITREDVVPATQDFYEYHWDLTGVDNIGATEIDQIDNQLLDVFLDGRKVKTTRYLELLGRPEALGEEPSGCYVKSLAYRMSIFFGTRDIGVQATKNSKVRVVYLKVMKSSKSIELKNITLTDPDFMISDLEIISPYYPEDSLSKIVLLAPSYHSARRMMVNKYDHEAILAGYPGLVSAQWVSGFCEINGVHVRANSKGECESAGGTWTKSNFQCCTSTLSYLFSDGHIANDLEKEMIYRYLEPFRHEGDAIDLIDPSPINLTRSYKILLEEGVDADEVTSQIKALIKKYTFKLGVHFQEEALHKAMRTINGIIYLYPVNPTGDMYLAAHQYFKLDKLQIQYETDMKNLINPVVQ